MPQPVPAMSSSARLLTGPQKGGQAHGLQDFSAQKGAVFVLLSNWWLCPDTLLVLKKKKKKNSLATLTSAHQKQQEAGGSSQILKGR